MSIITGFHFNKSLGQNFIVDETFLKSIVDDLKLDSDATVVEIGSGAGTLTRVLARRAGSVVTYEVDRRLGPVLASQFQGFENIELRFQDALKVKATDLPKEFTLVANIPYYITTPLLMKFILLPSCVRICVLVQDDVAKRIVAKSGGKDYGALSVTMQAAANCKIIKNVSRKLFNPQPNVDSAFVVIDKTIGADVPFGALEKLLKGMFAARRKTVLNALARAGNFDKDRALDLLARVDIEPNARPEQIEVKKYIELSRLFDTNI